MDFRAAYISYADYGGPLIHTKEFINAFQRFVPDLLTYCPQLETDLPYVGPVKETFFNKFFSHLPSWSRQVKLEFYQIRKLLRDWSKWPQFSSLYLRNNIDIIVVRSDAFVMGPIYAANKQDIPYLLEVNGILSKHESDQTTRQFEKYILSKASGIFVVCDPLVPLLLNLDVPRDKIRVIPNGVCLENFQSPDRAVIPSSLRLKLEEKIVVGYIGTFTSYHDMYALISGFAQAVEKIPDLCLLLIGEGKLTKGTKEKVKTFGIEDRVIFTGRISHEHIPSYLQLCSILVNPMQPIYKEAFHGAPIKMFEYMAAQKPIISTDLESLRHFLEDTAIFVSSGKANGWRDAVITLAQDEKLRQEQGKKAFEHLIKRGYTWEENARKVSEFCEDILSVSI
jgi:glycosyltransferase involved in cell wall biosynthesis